MKATNIIKGLLVGDKLLTRVCIVQIILETWLCLFVLPAAGRTNVELREQLTRPEGVTQAMGTFTSKRASDASRPSMTREHSGTQLRKASAEKPPAGPGRKPRLDVPSSGYGIRREKSGELRPRREKSGELRTTPSGPARQSSGTKLKGTAEKSSPPKKVSTSRVKKSDSQTSLGSTGSLEDSSESPRVSSGIPSSPSSTSSSRGSPDRPSATAAKSASSRRGSKETPQSTAKKSTSGIPPRSPTKTAKNGEEKSGKK